MRTPVDLGNDGTKCRAVCDSRSHVPEPAPGFGTEKGWWGSGMAGAFSVLARAGSPVGWVCTGSLCGTRESSASVHCGQEHIQELAPALCTADCFLPLRFGLNVTPQRGLPSAPHLAATLPCVSHHPVWFHPENCHCLQYVLHECRNLTDFAHCCVFNT